MTPPASFANINVASRGVEDILYDIYHASCGDKLKYARSLQQSKGPNSKEFKLALEQFNLCYCETVLGTQAMARYRKCIEDSAKQGADASTQCKSISDEASNTAVKVLVSKMTNEQQDLLNEIKPCADVIDKVEPCIREKGIKDPTCQDLSRQIFQSITNMKCANEIQKYVDCSKNNADNKQQNCEPEHAKLYDCYSKYYEFIRMANQYYWKPLRSSSASAPTTTELLQRKSK